MDAAAPPFSTPGNLANLLPTGTVLVFEALIRSFSNKGKCELANKYLTLGVMFFCSLTCIFSSFTDSFLGNNGKLYYGIATPSGLYFFQDGPNLGKDERMREELRKYRLSFIDFVHAFVSFVVFLVVAFSSLDVQRCFFHEQGKELFKHLPLIVGVFASALFTIFPTRRRGIGYGDIARRTGAGAGAGPVEEELKKQETVNGKGKERRGVHENEFETEGNNGPSRSSINLASFSHVNDLTKDSRNSFS